MDNLAKSLAKKDSTMSTGEVAVMVVKNKYSNNSQPQGHEALQTETDNIVLSEPSAWAKELSQKFHADSHSSTTAAKLDATPSSKEPEFDLIERFNHIFKKRPI